MEVKIKKEEWDSLPAGEREKIQSIIGSHFPTTTIVGDAHTAKSEALVAKGAAQAFGLSNPLCNAACGVAEAAAVAACSALSGGVAIAVCVAAAHAAGDFCRSRC